MIQDSLYNVQVVYLQQVHTMENVQSKQHLQIITYCKSARKKEYTETWKTYKPA